MHQILTNDSNYLSQGGGRTASPAYRKSLTQVEDFLGLPENIDRYDLLLLAKRVGKAAGFSSRMLQLLDYYMAYTRECDWEEGSRPIVFQSLARTALDLGVTERQIQKIEKQLFEVGALTWNDSGNHKRFGQRDPQTGRLLYAYGVELSPLAYLAEQLQEKLQEKQLADQAWLVTKRQISAARRQIRAMLLEWDQKEGSSPEFSELTRAYEVMAVQIRTHIDLSALRSMLQQHQELHDILLARLRAAKPAAIPSEEGAAVDPIAAETTSTSELLFAHREYTTLITNKEGSREDAGLQGSSAAHTEVDDPITSSGIPHISLRMATVAASERFQELLPAEPTWPDLIEAAYRLRPLFGISPTSWGEACEVLGRVGAMLCLLITDQAVLRQHDTVLRPAAYFRSMVSKARLGKLRLHSSIFGLLEPTVDQRTGAVRRN